MNVTRHYAQTVYIDLDSAAPRAKPYSRNDTVYRPARLKARWVSDDGDHWKQDAVTLSGPTLKKDGTDSANRTEETFSWWGHDTRAPEWAAALLRELQP